MSPSVVQQQHQILSLVMCFTKTMFRYLLEQVAITYFQTTQGQLMGITLVKLQPVKHQGHQRLIKLLSSFCVSYLKTVNPEMSFILCLLMTCIRYLQEILIRGNLFMNISTILHFSYSFLTQYYKFLVISVIFLRTKLIDVLRTLSAFFLSIS